MLIKAQEGFREHALFCKERKKTACSRTPIAWRYTIK
ncbi:hypothetical protein MNBD_GAMMA22-3140 [hydrothermal vent metagenome]|uniref:Uncharacterized protein n=1 Tax=hydrothermal vent metagenome TaxID=652676 RepID=A0A3B1A895_9ZZZZ